MVNRLLNYVLIFCLLSTAAASGLSRYEVELTLSNYSNPRQSRPFCTNGDCFIICCDNADSRGECPENMDESRCDSFFVYCLRSLNTSRSVGCPNSREVMSEVNQNDRPLNFSQGTVLGLDNPLILQGLTETWTGVQLHVEIRDQDPGFNEIIDVVVLNITQPAQIKSGKQTLTGLFRFVTMEVDLTVLCTLGYTGVMCNETDNCVNVTCSGNGQCVNGMYNYTCNCSEGYTGRLCEDNIDDCVSNPCGEGGQCVDGLNSFNCTCYQGFTGENCEINIDNCAGVNCSGRGRCEDKVNSFACLCDAGFTGGSCEVDIDDCVGVNCSGRGRCEDKVNSFVCLCDAGFTGGSCEVDIDDCVGVSCSGNGECLDGVNSFTCECSSGHSGPLCAEVQSVLQQRNTNIGPIVGGALGGCISLFIVVIIVAVIVILVRRRDRIGLGRSTKGSKHIALPGDNPAYELEGGSIAITVLGNPTAQTQVQYMNVPSQTNRERSESAPDHEFDNPIYGGNSEGEDTYSDPDTRQNGIGMGTSPYHKFDNPIYGDNDNEHATYSGIYETSTQMAQRLSRANGHDDGVTLTGGELVYDHVI